LTDPQGYGDANLRPPSTPRGVKKRAETTPLALGAPPPPAGAGMEEEADPVAGLFANDRIVPAPGISDSPSEAEIGRWVATAHTSLFDDRVKDPAPAAPEPAASVASEPRKRLNAPELDQLDQPPIPGMTEPLLAPRKPRAAAPAPPVETLASDSEPPAAVAKARAGSTSGARKRAAPAASPAVPDAEPSAADDSAAAKARKRRVERGPSKLVLAGLGAATMVALGVAAALLGVVPNPLAPSAAPTKPAVQARAAIPARPKPATPSPAAAVAAASNEAKPAAPAPTAEAKPSQPAAASKAMAPVAPAPVAVAPVVSARVAPAPVTPEPAAPTPVAPVAALGASAPGPSTASAFVPTRAPVVVEAADSESEEETGSNGAKLALARKLLSAEDPAGAEVIARQALAADPQDHHAMDALARALMDQDRGAEAVPLARRMVQKRGKRVQYRLLLGDLLFMVGNESDARAQWRQALELAPNDLDIKRRLNK